MRQAIRRTIFDAITAENTDSEVNTVMLKFLLFSLFIKFPIYYIEVDGTDASTDFTSNTLLYALPRERVWYRRRTSFLI
jgi:hypothetical protein